MILFLFLMLNACEEEGPKPQIEGYTLQRIEGYNVYVEDRDPDEYQAEAEEVLVSWELSLILSTTLNSKQVHFPNCNV